MNLILKNSLEYCLKRDKTTVSYIKEMHSFFMREQRTTVAIFTMTHYK